MKRQKKRLLARVLTAALLLTLLPAGMTTAAQAADSGTCGDHLTWKYDEGAKTLTISGTGKMEDFKAPLHSPWSDNSQRIENITIEDGVTSISNNAFYGCYNLAEISLPNSLTSIGNYAFYDCFDLTDISLPNGLTSIGSNAFASSGITSITIPSGVTSIGDSTFDSCLNLTSVTLPDKLTSIGKYAFATCTVLTSISIPDSVTSIGEYAFFTSAITSITIPSGVSSIGNSTFESCPDLTSVSIPISVTSIGENAFDLCNSLSSVYYAGSEAEWKQIAGLNYVPSKAEIHYQSSAPNSGQQGDGTTHKCAAFTDITGHWAHDAICYCVEPGYLTGVSTTSFAPEANMTRAMLVTLLWRIEKSPKTGSNTFSDVAANQYYTDAVSWSRSAEIVNGYDASRFGPDDAVTREQLATFLYRYAQYKKYNTSASGSLSGFSDAGSVSNYASTAVTWATDAKIITGYLNGTVRPQNKIVRAEVAAMFQRFLTNVAA